MDYSVTFARHYSRLVWLLLHETSNVDEQKASLRALVTVSKDGAVTLASDGADLAANGHDVPGVLSGVTDAVRRMTAHGVREIVFDAAATPAGVLGSARILAADASVGTGVSARSRSSRRWVRRACGSRGSPPRRRDACGATGAGAIRAGDRAGRCRANRLRRSPPSRRAPLPPPAAPVPAAPAAPAADPGALRISDSPTWRCSTKKRCATSSVRRRAPRWRFRRRRSGHRRVAGCSRSSRRAARRRRHMATC